MIHRNYDCGAIEEIVHTGKNFLCRSTDHIFRFDVDDAGKRHPRDQRYFFAADDGRYIMIESNQQPFRGMFFRCADFDDEPLNYTQNVFPDFHRVDAMHSVRKIRVHKSEKHSVLTVVTSYDNATFWTQSYHDFAGSDVWHDRYLTNPVGVDKDGNVLSIDNETGMVVSHDHDDKKTYISKRCFDTNLDNNYRLILSPNGQYVVRIVADCLQFADVTAKDRHKIVFKNVPMNAVAFSPDSRVLTVGVGNRVKHYDTETLSELSTFCTNVEEIHCLCWAPDGLTYAVGGMANIKSETIDTTDFTSVGFRERVAHNASGNGVVAVFDFE